ncbi:hypothetical protein H9Q70_014073 [Fusarium xylarioides]|nr:hypothetical protein H9Q70_014073 [Fusarium xylarioides]KAG5768831.1 hypothetical protein H9Q73_013714 [Fusarium xylarioides]
MIKVPAPNSKDEESMSLSKLIAGVSNVMPEWYPEEHVRTAQNLLTGPSSESTAEYFKVLVYMMSNSMVTDWVLSFAVDLIGMGKTELRAHFRKLRNENPTIQSFLENAFQFQITEATPLWRNKTDATKLEIITSLLELGVDPDYPCYMNDRDRGVLCTPIQQATRAGCLELIQLLLRFQAQVDRLQVSDGRYALVNLALDSPRSNSEKLRILAVLFDYGYLNKDEMIRAAIELHDEEAILSILDSGIDITHPESAWLHAEDRHKGYRSSVTFIANQSPLMMAVQAGGRIASLMLDHLLLKGQLSPSILADAYIAAAYGGHHDIMLRLDATNISEMVCSPEGITPLQAAVVGGNPAVCKHLLERHGGSSASLIVAAAILGNVEIIHLLIEYGGNPNALICTHDVQMYDYFNIGQRRHGRENVSELTDCYEFTRYHYGNPTPILTMLMHSVWCDFMEPSLLKLIQKGATVPHGEIATFSRLCFHTCLKAALDAGGDPNDMDEKGITALQCALDDEFIYDEDVWEKLEDQASKRLLTVELLIQAGAKLTGGEVVRAIRLRELPLILFLLQNGATLNDVDDAGRGCLEAEIEAQNDQTLQDALEAQELPIDAGPFCASIQQRDWALVGRLFKRAHKQTSCHLLEGTAVGMAARAGQLDILDKLLARFTHPSVLGLASLPLVIDNQDILTFSNTDDSDTDYWYQAGFWREATNHSGYTLGSPLAIAALQEDTSGFEELLGRGCKMDTVTWGIIAENQNSSDYLQVLEEFGCGLGSATEYDEELGTALCKAITEGKSDLAQYLLEVGADVNEYDIFTSRCTSPLQCAVRAGLIEVAVCLLEKKANINAPPAFDRGGTALQFAAIGGHIRLARQLLELGASINARGSGRLGRSALEGAAEHGRLDMVALLVHHGAVTSGRGRQQLINSVAFAQARAHGTVAEWLKKNCGWSDTDQEQLEFVDADADDDADYPVGKCVRAYCCDEYHHSDTQCVYHYTEEQIQMHYEGCERCEEFEDDWDDSSEKKLSKRRR